MDPQAPQQIAEQWLMADIVYNLNRSLPHWPSTYSAAFCGHGAARGGGYCTDCLMQALLIKLEAKGEYPA